MSTLASVDPTYFAGLLNQPAYLQWLGDIMIARQAVVCTAAYWIHELRGDTVRLRP